MQTTCFSEWSDGVPGDENEYLDDLVGWDFIPTAEAPRGDNEPADINGHGTHVAGIIAALQHNQFGVSGISQSLIMPLRFLNQSRKGDPNGAIAAMRYARQQQVQVINHSWQVSDNDDFVAGTIEGLREEMAKAEEAGILVVVAAGNEGDDLDDPSRQHQVYPAGFGSEFDNVITVAASDWYDRLYESNYGMDSVHLAAPGVHVYSTLPNDKIDRRGSGFRRNRHQHGGWLCERGCSTAVVTRAVCRRG